MARRTEKVKIRGAKTNVNPGFGEKFKMWLRHHRLEFGKSFQDIIKAPATSLMTMMVLAIALALPAGLQVVLKNSQNLMPGMDKASRISLYLKLDSQTNSVRKLANNLSLRQDIVNVNIIAPEQGLKTFEQKSGFGDALKYLDENPLPYVLEVTPSNMYWNADSVKSLLEELQRLDLVDKAQLDLGWIKRLYAMIQLAQSVVEALGLIFALAVILVIGNTIRLSVQSRQAEIKVIKLVGATNSYIRRPFLYSGIWFGMGGAILAWLLLIIILMFLQQPVSDLAATYSSEFTLSSLGVIEGIKLIFAGGALGWLGAWTSVTRHINQIEPGVAN